MPSNPDPRNNNVARYITRMVAWRLTSPINTMKYPISTVVKTSKKASAHICITHQRQKSAMTKLVVGVAMNPDISRRRILAVVYTIQLGRAHGCDHFITGLMPLYNVTTHSTRAAASNTCQSLPSSTYSQPWWPSQYQLASNPCGPKNMPAMDPATVATNNQKTELTNSNCLFG